MLLGERTGLSPFVTGIAAVALALGLVQLLAHGMTRPLREMVGAARAMSRGEYERRVTATSRDEVGELGRAFNRMAADLAEVDRVRRDLVANVSHELRTPLGALRAMLENLVDGVETADAESSRPCSSRSSVSAGSSSSCSSSRSWSRARCRSSARPSARRRSSSGSRPTGGRARGRAASACSSSSSPRTSSSTPTRRGLHQVVSNLVANAVRHAPAGSDVTVAARTNGHGACSR